jgi:hypothetical protein
VPQRAGRPPRQGLPPPPVRAPDRRGKVFARYERVDASSGRSGSGGQRQAAPIMVDDVYEEEEDDNMSNQHSQVQYLYRLCGMYFSGCVMICVVPH